MATFMFDRGCLMIFDIWKDDTFYSFTHSSYNSEEFLSTWL